MINFRQNIVSYTSCIMTLAQNRFSNVNVYSLLSNVYEWYDYNTSVLAIPTQRHISLSPLWSWYEFYSCTSKWVSWCIRSPYRYFSLSVITRLEISSLLFIYLSIWRHTGFPYAVPAQRFARHNLASIYT